MKVFVDPPRTMSQAMFRVANALKSFAPREIEIVRRRELADLQVMHVIGIDAVDYAASWNKHYAVLQYCVETGGNIDTWHPLWFNADLVWSYYKLDDLVGYERFYFAPLGVDGRIFYSNGRPRTTGVFTSGYVSGEVAEAIEEMTVAADRLNMSVTHLGPVPVVGEDLHPMPTPSRWRSLVGISDKELAGEYAQSLWVSGLRHVEGFELPAVEGLACGARPIVFDRPDMRQWYYGHAEFVPESTGEDLVDHLMKILSKPPEPVTPGERALVLARFSWEKFAEGFWMRLLENV